MPMFNSVKLGKKIVRHQILVKRVLFAAPIIVLHSVTQAGVAPKYELLEVPAICEQSNTDNCGTNSIAYDINNLGVVAGSSSGPMVPDVDDRDEDGNTTELVLSFASHAFTWNGGSIVTDLGDLERDQSFGFAINNNGTVTGRANKLVGIDDENDSEIIHPRGVVVAQGGLMQDIGSPAAVVNQVGATDISDAGHVVGYASAQVVAGSTVYYRRGFVKPPGQASTLTLIPSLEEKSESALRGVNSVAGRAVGYAVKGGVRKAIFVDLQNPDVLNEIGTLGGTASEAFGIDVTGRIVGRAYTTGNASAEGFIYYPTNPQVLRGIGQLGEDFNISSANAINSVGDVVGTAQASKSPTTYHAVIFESASDSAMLIDLNSRIDCAADASERWVLTEAFSINDNGQIVGYGSKGGVTKSFLLTPSSSTTPPEPCAPLEGEFENKSGGGSFSLIGLSLMLFLRRRLNLF